MTRDDEEQIAQWARESAPANPEFACSSLVFIVGTAALVLLLVVAVIANVIAVVRYVG